MISTILQQTARFLAPPVCLRCNREGQLICSVCRLHLPRPPQTACLGCGKPNYTGVTCGLCRRATAIGGLTAAATYDGLAQELIRLLKYKHIRESASMLAELLASELESSNFDCVTSVPVATNHQRARGYNQAELLARALARHLNLPYHTLLRRRRNLHQVGRSRAQRQRQIQGLFEAKPSLCGQRILLIDDVLTTGSTLNECAKALSRSGGLVWAAVAAVGEK